MHVENNAWCMYDWYGQLMSLEVKILVSGGRMDGRKLLPAKPHICVGAGWLALGDQLLIIGHPLLY